MNTLDIQNTGFIPIGPDPEDWISGAESGLTAVDVLPSGDWRPWRSSDERQKTVAGFETNCCVTFSANNNIEAQVNLAIEQGLYPAELVQWLRDNGLLDADGKLNLSDRFTAKMSGTIPDKGNSLKAVWQSFRDYGAVPESVWPFPIAEVDAAPTLEAKRAIYFAEPPAHVKAIGLEFKKRFEIQYEWIASPGVGLSMSQFAQKMKTSPLQIATAVCQPWNTAEVIKACGGGSGHATSMVHVELATCYWILDHYLPFLKRFAPDYTITYAMRGVIVPKVQPVVKPFAYTFTKNVEAGAPASDEVRALQTALQVVKDRDGKPFMRPGVFGPFGPQTQDALARFQREANITDEPMGTHFGPKTRAALNARLLSNTQPAPNYEASDGGGVTEIAMKLINRWLRWAVLSSSDTTENGNPDISLTVKMVLLGAIPWVMQAIGLACGLQLVCVAVDAGELEKVALSISHLVALGTEAVAIVGGIYAFGRKVWLSVQGRHIGLAS